MKVIFSTLILFFFSHSIAIAGCQVCDTKTCPTCSSGEATCVQNSDACLVCGCN